MLPQSPTAARAVASARRRVARLAAFALLSCAPGVARAQVTLVDEGTFSLSVRGVRVGREDFSIRAAPGPGGSAYVAQGIILNGTQRTSVALNADSAGSPLRFQLEALVEGVVAETISGEARRGLWVARALRSRGESAREFRLPAGVIAAEDDVIHQLWFVLRFGAGRSPSLLVPRSLTLRGLAIEDAGPDHVTLGGAELEARHWVLRPTDRALPVRDVWTDPRGRILRVRIAAQEFEALRDEPPRETPGS